VGTSKKRVSTPTIGRQAQDRIGRELRVMYAEAVTQPLPDQLFALLQAFEDAEAAQRRLREAVAALRQANSGLILPLAPRSTPPASLSVRAQQALLARTVLHPAPMKPAPRSRKGAVRAAS
jgi:hypothetical protein